MAQNWTDEQVKFLKSNLEKTSRELTDLYNQFFPNRTYDSINKKQNFIRKTMSIGNPFFFEEEVVVNKTPVGLTIDLPQLEKKDFGEQLNEWLITTSNYFQGVSHKPSRSSESSLCIWLSDLHFGKKTKRFDIEIAKSRIAEIPQLLQEQYISGLFDEIVLMLGGDEVEGEDIYSTQNGTLECPVIFQVQHVVEALFQLILDLEKTFKVRVRVEYTYGNHGRMSKSADVRSNWDNAAYMMIHKLLEMENNSNIISNLNFEAFKVVEVKDKRILITHHGTKHIGTPAGQNRFLGWVISKNLDMAIHGHWHVWKVESHMGRLMVSNGSLSGEDDLAEEMGVAEPPRQAIFLVKPGQSIKQFSFLEW